MKQALGESQINPQLMQQVAPDVVSEEGKFKLLSHLSSAAMAKAPLDTLLSDVANKIGAKFSSRIKNPETVVQKIAQKRLAGRSYDTKDVNDAYGGRIVVDSGKDISKVVSAIKQIAGKGAFAVLKAEKVHDDTYNAYHMDIKTPQGARAEVQVMLPHQQLEAMANHGLRAMYGDNPPESVQLLKEKQAQLAKNISKEQALKKSEALSKLSKANNDKPVDPRIIAQVLQKTV